MTDVEAKTPTKRSLSDTERKKGFAKKAKLSPKQQNKTPNKLNNVQVTQKLKKKNKGNASENGSPKKLKPFTGTAEVSSANKPNKPKKNKNATKQKEGKKKGKKSMKDVLDGLKTRIDAGEKEAIVKSLESKIKAIEGRDELTRSAKRKLKILRRLKSFSEGKSGQGQQQNEAGTLKTQKRRERKKKTISEATSSAAKQNKTGAEIVKQNEKGKKAKIESKPLAKKPKLAAKAVEEDEDSSEEEENKTVESEDDSGTEEEVEEEEQAEDESEESSDEEGEGEEESEDEDDEESDDSEEDSPPQGEEDVSPKKKLKSQNLNEKVEIKNSNPIKLEELEKNKIIIKNQKRFIVFVGNIPYDTDKYDLKEHFQKCGEVKHIRIPTEKGSSKPRGFAYVEVGNEEAYQKCLSMHHTFLKRRRINVLYTQGGKKKGDDKKKEIKAKNFKLHAMRKEGKLAGSKKESHKRSFRRAKQRAFKAESESQE